MKIVLTTGAEYSTSGVSLMSNGMLCISLIDLKEPLNETIIRKAMSTAAMASLKYYNSDTEYTVYENYTLLESYNVKFVENAFNMTLYFSKVIDNKRIEVLEGKCNVLSDVTNFIATDLVPSIKIGM